MIESDPLREWGLDPASSNVLIVGLGKTGLSVARFLSDRGIPFVVTDTRAHPPMRDELLHLIPDAVVVSGGLDAAPFDSATHLVVSPGLSLAAPEIQRALHRGVPLLSDVDLFSRVAKAPVIAITGSNGKSTVTVLVGLMADVAGWSVKVGGNLGTPALDLLDENAELYVLELSSFQLERTSCLGAAAAAVLNVSCDHMDRYADMTAYALAKRRIFDGCAVRIVNADDPTVAAMAEPGGRWVRFGMKASSQAQYSARMVDGAEWIIGRGARIIPTAELRIKGRHNVANALAAVALADALGLPRAAMAEALKTFAGLDHRMQWVAEMDGVQWYNDSKATNIGACVAALEGIEGKVVLIAGGDGKDADFAELAAPVKTKARAVVLMGRDATLIADALGDSVPLFYADSMKDAVTKARAVALPGDSVLLAPACSSLDQYRDYQERGCIFVESVRGLPA